MLGLRRSFLKHLVAGLQLLTVPHSTSHLQGRSPEGPDVQVDEVHEDFAEAVVGLVWGGWVGHDSLTGNWLALTGYVGYRCFSDTSACI